MRIKYLAIIGCIAVSCMTSGSSPKVPVVVDTSEQGKAFIRNGYIGTGINLGNALEAPNEGEWGMVIEERFIDSIQQAGFNSVRIPVCWSCHTDTIPPYTVDPDFVARVDEVVNWCLSRDLVAIVTVHHFNLLYDNPDSILYNDMLFAIWRQLSEHFIDTDHDKLIFEPLNEPHSYLKAGRWNLLMPDLIKSIRDVDTDRTLILDVADYANHNSLSKLRIPDEEQNCIVSVRYYLPYEFTHQGAHWAEGSDEWLGTTWTATERETTTVIADMDYIESWSGINNRPITIGEWGAIIYCDSTSRLIWTEYVRRQMQKRGFSSNYFDFGVIFRIFDIKNDHWLDGFPEALLGE